MTISMNRIFLLIVILILSGLASAQTTNIEGKPCSTKAERLKYTSTYIPDYYRWLTDSIERVPPDVTDYLEKERLAIFESEPPNKGRFLMWERNPFRPAWELHYAIKSAIERSKIGVIATAAQSPKDQLKKEMLFYFSLLKTHIKVMEKFDDYLSFDIQRKYPIFKQDKEFSYKKITLDNLFYKRIDDLIECAFQ